jgi:hypothetical protein
MGRAEIHTLLMITEDSSRALSTNNLSLESFWDRLIDIIIDIEESLYLSVAEIMPRYRGIR